MGASDIKQIFCCQSFSSAFGNIGLVWTPAKTGAAVIKRIFLPPAHGDVRACIREAFPGVKEGNDDAVGPIIQDIQEFLKGREVVFSLDYLDLAACGVFQRKVLHLKFAIPRGKVTSYGRLAEDTGSPRAARAAGTALARNPFPIIIPCHRAVRADGLPGGFGGGLKMKLALLEMEGIGFDRRGRVNRQHFLP